MDSSGSDSIKVCIRVRPPNSYQENTSQTLIQDSFEGSSESVASSGCCLEVATPTSIILHSKPEPKTFTFDYVAGPHVVQEDIFTAVGRPIIDGCMDGYNGTIFAYGQTGSGKTFTMIGPSEEDGSGCATHELRGVIPRSFEYLFSLMNREKLKCGDMVDFLCKCSFLEIYNEQVYDLLDPASPNLHLRENMKKGVYVDGIVEQVVTSAVEAYEVLNRGWTNRRVASTSMNRESSRSHAVFMLSVESKKRDSYKSVCKIRSSTLNLVDLAGSERQRDTHTVGIRLKEAGSINKSLSVLGNVIMALVDIAGGKSRHVHYRDSKLTFLLRDSLGGNSKTNLIANVHPLARCFGESLSTLQFARRAKLIKNKAVVNEDTTGDVSQLQLEIKRLRETISQLRGGVVSVPEPLKAVACGAEGVSEEGGGKVNDAMAALLMNLRAKAESENKVLRDKVGMLQELCRRKDKSLQTTKMILKLRDSHIASLVKHSNSSNLREMEGEESRGDNEATGHGSSVRLLQEEIHHLKLLVDHNPEITRYAMENQSLKAEVKRLKEKVGHSSRNEEVEREASSLRQYTLQLEGQLQALREGNTPPPTTVRQLADLNSQIERLQSHCQKLQTELDCVNKQLYLEREEQTMKVNSLEASLDATKKANHELERKLEGLKIRHKIERESLNESRYQSLKAIMTPSSIRRTKSATSTPLQLPSSSKLRQKLFFQPISVSARTSPGGVVSPLKGSNDDDREVKGEESGDSVKDREQQLEEVGGAEEGVVSEAILEEIRELQEVNNNLRKELESKECDMAQLKSREVFLIAQDEGLSRQLEELRGCLRERDSLIQTAKEGSSKAILKLESESSVLQEEIRDLRLCLQSADKELLEAKNDLKSMKLSKEAKINELFARIAQLEQECSNKTSLHEKTVMVLHNIQDEVETLREELRFKSHYLQEKEEEISKGNKALLTLHSDIENLEENLALEREKLSALASQMEDDDVMKQRLAQVLEENNKLVKERNEGEEKLCLKDKQLISAQSSIQSLTSQLSEGQTAVNELMSTVNQLRKREVELEAELALMQSDRDDHRTKLNQCQVIVDTLTLELRNLEEAINKQKVKHIKELRAWELQREINESQIQELQEDGMKLLEVNEVCNKLQTELERSNKMKKDMEKQLDAKEEEIQNLQTALLKKSSLSDGSTLDVEMYLEKQDQVRQLEDEKASYSSLILDLQEMLEEKETHLSNYKVKMSEFDSLQRDYDLLWTQSQSQQYRIEADKEENSKRFLELESELERLKHQVSETEAKYSVIEQERNQACKRSHELEQQIENSERSLSELESQMERVRSQEEALFREKEELRSQLEAAWESKAKLSKENQELVKENAQLSGHRNIKQRVQFHAKLKMDYHKLLEEHRDLATRYQQKVDYIAKVETSQGSGGTDQDDFEEKIIRLKPHKENIRPY